jgi:cell wall-associated NlpC family hydrolase
MTTRADIVAAARSYLGVRWHHQGRNRAGMDCIGLVIAVARDLGISDYDITAYARVPDGNTLRATMAQQMDLLKRDPRPGDVMLLSFQRNPLHTAIVTDAPGGLGMIHAFANKRMVVEHGFDATWRSRLVCAFGYRGVE